MAENITGTVKLQLRRSVRRSRLPCASRSICSGFLPRNTRVSIGSRKRVDGGVGDLRGVDAAAYPNRPGRASGCPWRKAARRPLLGLPVNLANGARRSSWRFPAKVWSAFHNLQRPGGAERHAAVAVDALGLVRRPCGPASASKRCTSLAHCRSQTRQLDAAALVPHHLDIPDTENPIAMQFTPPSIARSPARRPRGAHTRSSVRLDARGWPPPRWRHIPGSPFSPTTMAAQLQPVVEGHHAAGRSPPEWKRAR